jgi:hypothetical protein
VPRSLVDRPSELPDAVNDLLSAQRQQSRSADQALENRVLTSYKGIVRLLSLGSVAAIGGSSRAASRSG